VEDGAFARSKGREGGEEISLSLSLSLSVSLSFDDFGDVLGAWTMLH